MDFLVILLIILVYLLPSIAAHRRNHRSASAITILNVALGWTVLGWLLSLMWAYTGNTEEHQDLEDRVPCPECKELVIPGAKKCKHCGSTLSS